ncbi:hypothetical protein, partial [Candidatus Hakubella thermalkaliphila]|uniref:hypothetical protein n=1 Tax=Candidatus Hakubella thermalkaliphila TaxID=2754717 RepID=UPI0015947286
MPKLIEAMAHDGGTYGQQIPDTRTAPMHARPAETGFVLSLALLFYSTAGSGLISFLSLLGLTLSS